MTRVGLVALVFFLTSVFVGAEAIVVDRSKVTVERRAGRDWCVLDSQVSGTVAASLSQVRSVIEDYERYPLLFADIKAASVVRQKEAALVTETVTISAMGITNTNRFTLRVVTQASPEGRSWHSVWSQESTDGTIDSLEGGWTLEEVGATDRPLLRVTYRNHSAVPVRVPGQDVVIGMFLSDSTKAVVEAVFKKALSH